MAEPEHSSQTTNTFLIVAGSILFAVFLYSIRSVLIAPIMYVAILALLWQYQSNRIITTVIYVTTGLFAAYLIVELKTLIPAAVVSTLLIVLLRGPVEWLVKRNIRRNYAVLIVMAVSFAFLSLVLIMVIPALVEQSRILVILLPTYYDRLHHLIVTDWLPALQSIPFLKQVDLASIQDKLPEIAQRALRVVSQTGMALVASSGNVLGQLVNLFLVPIIVLYLLLDEKSLIDSIAKILPSEQSKNWQARGKHISTILGKWLKGQIMVSTINGTLIGIGLAIIGENYALMLGTITVFLCFIPYIGLLTSFSLAVLIALTGGAGFSFIMLIALVYIVVQLVESNLITPRVMGKAVGLSDLVTIIAIAIGAELFGFFGIIFAVPVTAIAVVFIREWWSTRERIEIND